VQIFLCSSNILCNFAAQNMINRSLKDTKSSKDIMNDSEKLYFLSFCVEAYKMRHNMSGEAVLNLFDEKGVTQYLIEYYDVLHTQSEKWIVAEIDEFIQNHDTISRK